MPNLGGFEVVAELTVAVLNQILQGAWDNNIIPHSTPIQNAPPFGPYQVADGVVNIARDDLALVMNTNINGVSITLGAQIQVEIANPPVPSATFFDMRADIVADVPIGVLPGTIQVAALLNGLARANVSATLTSGDPIPPITLALIAEYVHARYTDGTIPATITQNGISLPPFTADAFTEIFDDASNASRRIEVSQPLANKVKLRIPIHLRLSNISALAGPTPLSPMGVEARIALTADLVVASGSITARFATAVVDVEDLAPAPGVEGNNYNANKAGAAILGIDLELLLKNQIRARGQTIVAALGDHAVVVPTVANIEDFIEDQAHAALIGRGNIGLWTPTPPPDGSVPVTDVKPFALADAIAFCLNNPAGNTGVIVNFIPAGRTCAIAIDGARVLQIIQDQINKPESEGGFGGLPHTFPDIDGHEARLTRLDASLRVGSIHLEGDVTVVDAIADSIDVDASFEAEVGLQWQDNPTGGQMIQPFTISEDVDLSVLAWIVSFLLGFITFGLVGGIIGIVVIAVVEGIAERVGGAIIRDEVTGQVKGIGAWPQSLEGIGEVTTRFENPILIDPQSVMFPDAYLVTATFADTITALAEANGPYLIDAGAPVNLVGGPARPVTDYGWNFGDGNAAAGMAQSHIYGDDGVYVAKHDTTVNEPGGIITRQFAAVRARNVPPRVDAGPDLVIDEGQVVEFVATFTDQEWLDTHRGVFDFGDDSLPIDTGVDETNNPPSAQGTLRAKHAYCDNGDYLVTVKVRDDDGGVGIDTRRVTVRNVPPKVDAGEDMFAYLCTPITLQACFTDPGWCDTHTATWDFGDCTPLHPAIVHETHKPPAGIGLAAAIHIYQYCGSFLARCRVTDDDGGVGEDTIIVRVVDLLNHDFEGGFRNRLVGSVANAWEPYGRSIDQHFAASASMSELAASSTQSGNPTLFMAEEFVVHGGQRSQRINGLGAGNFGIYQQVGTNRGWDYQLSTWYHLDERAGGTCRIGIDPTGGLDAGASTVVWSTGNEQKHWAQLAGRVTAQGRQLTLFLEVVSDERGAIAYFDDAQLLPYPCPLEKCGPARPPVEQSVCVDWREEGEESHDVGQSYKKDGFTFHSLTQLSLRIANWGQPPNVGKLQFSDQGMRAELPFVANRVVARVSTNTRRPILMQAYDDSATQVGEALSSNAVGTVQTLEINAANISTLLFSGGGNEGLVIEICIYSKSISGAEKPGHDDDETEMAGWQRSGDRIDEPPDQEE